MQLDDNDDDIDVDRNLFAVRSIKLIIMDYTSILVIPILFYCYYSHNRYAFTFYDFDDWFDNPYNFNFLFLACIIQILLQLITDFISIIIETQYLHINTIEAWNDYFKINNQCLLIVYYIGAIFMLLYAMNEFPNAMNCKNLNYCTCLDTTSSQYIYLCT